MSKLHHKTLEAAVNKYGPLQGKSEEEVKAEIAADEKGFTPDQVNEIYRNLEVPGHSEDDKPPVEDKGRKGKFIVVKPFRDLNDFSKRYLPLDDVSYFDKDRLKHLLEIGFVEKR